MWDSTIHVQVANVSFLTINSTGLSFLRQLAIAALASACLSAGTCRSMYELNDFAHASRRKESARSRSSKYGRQSHGSFKSSGLEHRTRFLIRVSLRYSKLHP